VGVFDSEGRARVVAALEHSVPGSTDVNAIAYVEELLSAFDHDPPHIWASPEGGWLELGPWEAHAWRTRVAGWAEVYARVAAGAPIDGDLDVVHQHACEANYGDPVYGGNADRGGWVRVGFPSPMYPPGWRAS
jgi:hypothetical protein